jgi:uncharacterized protein YecE (DUF72 family)
MRRRDDDTPPLFPGLGPERNGGAPEAAELRPGVRELAATLPGTLRFGTSSWSFPGWRGLVYRDEATESALAKSGLAAYARHPLMRSVGVDKTFYRPAPREEFARLAAQVPDDFRFLVKMWRGLVEPEHFLDARIAESDCVRPAVEGLGDKAGPILFQFPPMRLGGAAAHRAFVERLRAFLKALPRGPLYAVEVRNRTLVAPELGEALADAGAVPCLTVHPTMPEVEIQSRDLALDPTRPLVMRWMLRANHAYAEAKDLYAPFDRIVEPDDASRDALARLARAAVGAGLGAWVIVNNKAEGSSPLSVERLARAVADAPAT